MLSWILKKRNAKESVPAAKTLVDVKDGESVHIDGLTGDDHECERLREMGFCEKALVKKVSENGALLCKVCGSKVIISEGLAKNILVGDKTQPEDDMSETKKVLLSELKEGQFGVVHDFIEENDTCARLEEMGVTPGEKIQVVRYAPMGDPIEIKVRGYLLSLRREEAELIEVKI